MKPNRIAAVLAVGLLTAASCVFAQAEPPKVEKKSDANVSVKKDEKKAVAKKDAKKDVKKDVKKDAKKDEKKIVAKSATKTAPPPAKQVKKDEQVLGPGTYSTGPTTLRDKDGNVIPTAPDAYNVDSAVKKKK